MELATILRELWNLRRWVALAALVAVLSAGLSTYRVEASSLSVHSRSFTVGIASARVLIDTPRSRAIDLGGNGADFATLESRANLLANLMASGPVKAAIAREVGVRSDDIVAIAPSTSGATRPVAGTASPAVASSRDALVLTLAANPDIPIILVDAQAPDARLAAKLANASVAGLRQYLGSIAAEQSIPDARQLVVTQLGSARGATVKRGPSRTRAVILMVVVFTFGCLAILLVSNVVRSWRDLTAVELARKSRPGARGLGDASAARSEGGRSANHGSRSPPDHEYAR